MKISEFTSKLSQLNIIVIGDLMLDKYLWGSVERISPEAPVPIVDIYKEESRLGGAANVALNLHALGVNPILCGVVGDDDNGREFLKIMAEVRLTNEAIIMSEDRRTTTKFRILGNKQQMLRVDKEDRKPFLNMEDLIQNIKKFLKKGNVDAIIFEDYDKGLISKKLIDQVNFLANHYNIPTFVDPKFENFKNYGNCTVFKPNLKELKVGIGKEFSWIDIEDLKSKAMAIQEYLGNQYLVITMSEHGVLAVGRDVVHIPAHYRQIVDVSGAGDTVISVLAASMTAGLDFATSCALANLAGGLVCEKVGVVPIDLDELLKEIKEKKIIFAN